MNTSILNYVRIALLAVLLLALPATSWGLNRMPAPQWPDGAEPTRVLQLRKDARSGLFLVDANLNGKPCTLLFDSGTTHTTFDKGFLRKNFPDLPLQDIPLSAESNLEIPKVQFFNVDSLKLGKAVELKNFAGITIDLAAIRSIIGEPVDGILGNNCLIAAPYLFSATRSVLQWVPSAEKAGKGFTKLFCQAMPWGGMILPCRNSENKTFNFLVDTGASYTTIPASQWKMAKKIDTQVASINSGGFGQQTMGQGVPLNLYAGNFLLAKGYAPMLAQGDIPCLLGLDLFYRYDVIVDAKQNALWVKSVPQPEQPAEKGTSVPTPPAK